MCIHLGGDTGHQISLYLDQLLLLQVSPISVTKNSNSCLKVKTIMKEKGADVQFAGYLSG